MANETKTFGDLYKEAERIDADVEELYTQLGKQMYSELHGKEFPNKDVELVVGRITALDQRKTRVQATIESIESDALKRAWAETEYACPSCGSRVMGADSFCMACGCNLEQHCANCGAPLAQGDAYCLACGTKVQDDNAQAKENETAEEKEAEPTADSGSVLPRVCPSCGQKLSENDIFCKKCGTKVS